MACFDRRIYPLIELLLLLGILELLLLLLKVLASVAVLALLRRFSAGGGPVTSEAGLQSLGDLGVDVLVHAAEQRIAALLVATRSGSALVLVPVVLRLVRRRPGDQTGRWLRRTTAAAGAKVLRLAALAAPLGGLIRGQSSCG